MTCFARENSSGWSHPTTMSYCMEKTNTTPLLTGWRCYAVLALFWAGTLSTWATIASGSFEFSVFLAAALLAATLLGLGHIVTLTLLPTFPLATDALFVFLCGFVSLNTLLFLLGFLVPYGPLFNLLLLIGAIVFAFPLKKDLQPRLHTIALNDAYAVLTLLIAAVAPMLWFQESFHFASFEQDAIVFHQWGDIFFHSTILNIFSRDSGLDNLHSIFTAGEPLPMYHYAAYTIPAMVKTLSEAPALLITTTVMPSLGLFLVALSAYCLGQIHLPGPGGLLAVCAVALFPDPSFYGVSSRWTSYFFFLEIAVAVGYTIAVMGFALTLILGGLKTHLPVPVWMGVIMAGVSVFFKAPIAIAYALVLGLTAFLLMPRCSRTQRVLLSGGILAGFLVLILVLRGIPGVPTLEFSSFTKFPTIETMLSISAKPIGLIQSLFTDEFRAMQSTGGKLLVGFVLVSLGYLGIFLLLLPFGLRYAIKNGMPRYFVAYPLVVMLNLFIVAMCMAPNSSGSGDAHEITHKTFVWPYFAVAAWLGTVLGGPVRAVLQSVATTIGPNLLAPLVVVLVCATPLYSGHHTISAIGRPNFNLPMPRDLYECALFLRTHSRPDAVVQLQRPQQDPWLMFPAVSERYSFAAAFTFSRTRAKDYPEYQRRVALMDALVQESDPIQAITALRKTTIDWFVVNTKPPPAWLAHRMPDFASGDYRVYKVATL
jgi:hypothetical protein